jgi:hypothetical protein
MVEWSKPTPAVQRLVIAAVLPVGSRGHTDRELT